MKTLRQALEDYLALRHAMGFKLSEAGTLLPQFVEFLAQRGHTFITTAEAVAVGDPTPACPTGGWASRLRCGAGLCALPSCHRPPNGDPATGAPAVPSATSCAVSLQ